jgi:hypothetical protein
LRTDRGFFFSATDWPNGRVHSTVRKRSALAGAAIPIFGAGADHEDRHHHKADAAR